MPASAPNGAPGLLKRVIHVALHIYFPPWTPRASELVPTSTPQSDVPTGGMKPEQDERMIRPEGLWIDGESKVEDISILQCSHQKYVGTKTKEMNECPLG